jgi:hypothetical protein
VAASIGGEITLAVAFPLLDAYVEADAERTELESSVQALTGEGIKAAVRLVRTWLLDAESTISLGAACPGLFALLDERLPFDELGTRVSNVFRRKRFRRWRDIVALSPAEFMSLENFGAGSLADVVECAVRHSVQVLARDSDDDDVIVGSGDDGGEQEEAVDEDDTLGDLYPRLRIYDPAEALPPGVVPPRLAHRTRVQTWGELLGMRAEDLYRLDNVGAGTVGRLLSNLQSVAVPASRIEVQRPSQTRQIDAALEALGGWAVSERGATTVGDVLAVRESLQPLPPRIEKWWQRARTLGVVELGDDGFRAGQAIDELLASIEERELRILRDRVWTHPRRATLEELGEALDMTRERVRQIESRVVGEIRARVVAENFAPVADRAFDLRAHLGTAVPEDGPPIADVRRLVTRDVSPDRRADAWDLLRWFAGPYRSRDGWLVAEAGGPAADASDLRAAADSSGFLSDERAAEALSAVGVLPEWHVRWIEHVGRFRRLEGGWFDASGGVFDQAVRYLTFRGIPMTVEQILEEIDRTDASVRSMRQRLFEDPRIVRVSKTEIALKVWGREEYTGIADEMVEEIERSGGRVRLDDLVERLVETFGVSATSVRMYAGRPMFSTDQDGFVSLRTSAEPYELRDDLSMVAGCYELDAVTASWRVPVDRDVLRGSGRHIPEQLAGWIRLRPGETMILHNALHPLPLAWRPWAQPDIGSLKTFAEQLNAQNGDHLVVVLTRSGTVDVRLVRQSWDAPPLERLAALIGIDASGAEDLLGAVGRAVGVDDSDAETARFRIHRALQDRRDSDILSIAEEALFG